MNNCVDKLLGVIKIQMKYSRTYLASKGDTRLEDLVGVTDQQVGDGTNNLTTDGAPVE